MCGPVWPEDNSRKLVFSPTMWVSLYPLNHRTGPGPIYLFLNAGRFHSRFECCLARRDGQEVEGMAKGQNEGPWQQEGVGLDHLLGD